VVQVTGLWTYPAATNSCVADGKPYKQISINLAAETDIAPLKLVEPTGVAATTFDLATTTGANVIWDQCILMITDIPADYPGRNMWDKATAWSSGDTRVPAVEVEVDRDYYLTTATDMTGYNQGQILTVSDGDLSKATDESPDALVCLGHCFQLRYAVSATEIVVRYKGLAPFDMT
jgi:hypothetical protein